MSTVTDSKLSMQPCLLFFWFSSCTCTSSSEYWLWRTGYWLVVLIDVLVTSSDVLGTDSVRSLEQATFKFSLCFFRAHLTSRSFISLTFLLVHILFVAQYFFLLFSFSALTTLWSALYLIATTLILFDMAGSKGLWRRSNLANCYTARELNVDGWNNKKKKSLIDVLEIWQNLNDLLQKIFYRFEISILKFEFERFERFDSELWTFFN